MEKCDSVNLFTRAIKQRTTIKAAEPSPVDTAAAVHGRLQVADRRGAGIRTPPHTQTGVSVSSALVARKGWTPRGDRVPHPPTCTTSQSLSPSEIGAPFHPPPSRFDPPSPPQTTAHASSNRLNVRRLSNTPLHCCVFKLLWIFFFFFSSSWILSIEFVKVWMSCIEVFRTFFRL